MDNPNYYAIIPANVRYDKELTPNAKLLYAEISALCNKNGYCWSTNQYFSNLYEVSKVSVSKWISQLIKKGYINSHIEYKEGSKEINKRYLSIINNPNKEKFNTPIKENFKDNNTSINNTRYNKRDQKENLPPNIQDNLSFKNLQSQDSDKFIPEEEKEKSCAKKEKEIFDLFNEKCKGLEKAQTLTAKRKESIKNSLEVFGQEKLGVAITMCSVSKFLNGSNERQWKASLDWFFKEENIHKVLEGQYKNVSIANKNTETQIPQPRRNR